MLQALLADRFKLRGQRASSVPNEGDTAWAQAAALEIRCAKQHAAERRGTGIPQHVNGGAGAARLPENTFGFDRPVIDQTALAGTFDFTMKLAGYGAELKSSMERRETKQNTSLFLAPLRDLGLRLQPERLPVEILIVDHADIEALTVQLGRTAGISTKPPGTWNWRRN